MSQPKRALCIMDMAGVGRSSLAVVLPALSACGVQACPLPTSLFSTHTGGFGEVAVQDDAAFCTEALAHYRSQDVPFEAVYTGYLLGEKQFTLARQALAAHPAALKVVDPAMADNGRLYTKITPAMAGWMAGLCDMADLITPNLTESALLLEEDAAAPVTEADVLARAGRLAAGKRAVVITSAPVQGSLGVAGCGKDGESWAFPVPQTPGAFPGTGDLFTAALVGGLLQGAALESAARRAAAFVARAAAATFAGGGEARHGLWFEPFLPMLAAPGAAAE